MLEDLLPLVAALAVAAVIYALRERHYRRTRIRPTRPDLTLAEAWELWHPPAGMEVLPEVREQARQSLLATAPAIEDLRSLRSEILRSATTALYLETILQLPEPDRAALLKGYQPGMEPLVRSAIGVSEVRWRVLRQYGHLKYDDAVPEDWFDQYLGVARPYIREKVRLARAFLVELDQGAARLVEIYDEMLQDLGDRLLASPRKKRFAPADLMLASQATPDPEPRP